MELQGTSSSGKGGINKAAINSEGEQETFAVSEEEIEHVSEASGLAFNWSSDLVDVAAGDGTVLLVKNTSSTHHLHIEQIDIANGALESEYTVHLPTTEVTVTGTTVTGTSTNTSKGEVAVAIAASKETNNSQGNVIGTVFMAINSNVAIDVRGIILGTNKSIAVDVVADTAESAVSIVGFYKEA